MQRSDLFLHATTVHPRNHSTWLAVDRCQRACNFLHVIVVHQDLFAGYNSLVVHGTAYITTRDSYTYSV